MKLHRAFGLFFCANTLVRADRLLAGKLAQYAAAQGKIRLFAGIVTGDFPLYLVYTSQLPYGPTHLLDATFVRHYI
jgi:hypothetical protein